MPAGAPELEIKQRSAPKAPAGDEVKFVVSSLHIAGARAFSEADLVAATRFEPGRELTFSDLRSLAARVAEFYRRNGYFVAQAYLPPQEIKAGTVTIAVIEGEYGRVDVHNDAGVSQGLVNGVMRGLKSGDTISAGPLEERLLLLSDIPGVSVKSTLIPGASVGASDLIIRLTPGARFSGDVDVDNEGNRYTGSNRVGVTGNLNDPTGRGDLLSVRGLTSGSGLQYGRAAYQIQVDRARIGIAYTSLQYRLGEEFASLQGHGTASLASVYGSYPLLRSRKSNINVLIDYDAKRFDDQADAAGTSTRKKAGVWMTSLTGDRRDGFAGGGLDNYSVTWTHGTINLEGAVASASDASTARTNGSYDKLGFAFVRLQRVTEQASVYASIAGQLASKNLDVSEKMALGGATAVRAYPTGEGYCDEGYVLNVEVRRLLRRPWDAAPGQMQVVGFLDTGTGRLSKHPWVSTQNYRTLSGLGLGIDWAVSGDFDVKVYYAHKLGAAAVLSAPDMKSRVWFQAAKFF